jgi:XTP/dITP diphosphohydrolase
MKIYLVTKNKHKVDEAQTIFSKFNIDVEQLNEEKYEPKEMSLKEVSVYNAKLFYKKYKKPIIVDDTGVFFNAYKEFPGNHPKLMFNLLGYKGLLKLVDGEDRTAQFRTVVTYCDYHGLKSFTGTFDCEIDTKIHDLDKDVLPYERILLYDGKPISSYSRELKNKFSHRAKAFKDVANFLTKE